MKLLRKLLLLIFIIILTVGGYFFLIGYHLYNSKVNEMSLTDKVNQIQEKKDFVPYSELPTDLINATIAVEDHRFWDHGAIDPIGITRAMYSNVKAKNAVEGGSTITQQVAKNLYFMEDNQYNLSRKSAELIFSYHLTKNYSKEQIFELYVNTIYYGNGYYGIRQAAKGYFGKEPKDLTLSECTLLAGVPNAPSLYAPTVNMDLCISRQKKVIKDMVKHKYITQEQANAIKLGIK